MSRPRPLSTGALLGRVLAGWLAVVLALQALAMADALGAGPAHHHHGAAAAAARPDTTALLRHDRAGRTPHGGVHETAHETVHHHADTRRHHHAPAAAGVARDAEEAARDGAAGATAALAALATAMATGSPAGHDRVDLRHVLAGGPRWADTPAAAARPAKPPDA